MSVLVGWGWFGVLGHGHVGGEIRGIYLLQGAHRALNGPSGVQPEPHPHLKVSGPVLRESIVCAVVDDALVAVDGHNDLQIAKSGSGG